MANTGSVDVSDFGAAGNGTTDDTSAIQNALNSGANLVLLDVAHLISSRLMLPTNVTIRGLGRTGTTITQSNTGNGHFGTAGPGSAVEGMQLAYSGTPADGAISINVTASDTHMSDILIAPAGIGIQVAGSAATFIREVDIYSYSNIGLLVTKSNDCYLSRFIFNAGTGSNAASMGKLGGIRLVEQVEAFVATDGDVLGGAYSITTDATNYAIGARPAYNRFTNVYFDSSVYGSILNNTVESTFTSCWWSAGRVSNSQAPSGSPGLLVQTTDSLVFVDCEYFNCGFHGCEVGAASKRVVFDTCKFESNSVTSGIGNGEGIYFLNGCTDFVVRNCIAHNGLYTGVQGYGIAVAAGASDRYIIQGNLVSGNYVAGVSDNGTGTNKLVASNF